MQTSNSGAKPGDFILDRYMPNASEAEREEARANLYAFVAVLLRIAQRRTDEEIAAEFRTKGEGAVESEDGSMPSL